MRGAGMNPQQPVLKPKFAVMIRVLQDSQGKTVTQMKLEGNATNADLVDMLQRIIEGVKIEAARRAVQPKPELPN